MPVASVLLTDTFGQWVTKTNALISVVNSLGGSAAALEVASPATGQILVYNGSFFVNVTMGGDATIASDGTMTVNPGSFTGVNLGRLSFL